MSENNTHDRTEAIQGVVDRVSAYQDGAPEGTVETELRSGLYEAGLDLDARVVAALAEGLEYRQGNICVADVLAG